MRLGIPVYNRQMRKIIVIAHDMRSLHNVGSLLRTAEGLGIDKVFLTGYTPHPSYPGDSRLPHIGQRQTKQIHKTALGAEKLVDWQYVSDVKQVIEDLKNQGIRIVGLEQTSKSVMLNEFKTSGDVALLLGREVEGLDLSLIEICDDLIEIPMFGQKESFNVVEAAAMTLYQLRFQ